VYGPPPETRLGHAHAPQQKPEDVWSPDYEEFGDGTSDEVAIALALKSFSMQASTRNASKLDAKQHERIQKLIDTKPQVEALLSHTLLITVLPSMALSTGQTPKERRAKHNAAGPTSKQFWKLKDLEY